MLWRFLTVLLGTAALLAVLDLLPAGLGGDPRGVVRYPSLAALEARYHVRLSAPAGLPLGELRVSVAGPGWVAFAVPASAGARVVCQTLAPAGAQDAEVPAALLPAGQRLQTSELSAGNRRAELRRVLLADGTLVHELWWREGGRRVMLRVSGDADPLVRLFNEGARQAR